jgi:peptidoglycan hydrolase-like protein with peptidoglycan-binding domain
VPKSSVYPGLDRKKGGKSNWVEAAGGLPSYIERVAKHIHYEGGHPISTAIAMAVSQVKKWAAKGNAQAVKAVAQWEKMKASTKGKKALREAVYREGLLASPDEIAAMAEAFHTRAVLLDGLTLAEDVRMGALAAARDLLEGRDATLRIDARPAPAHEVARVRLEAQREAALLHELAEMAGFDPARHPRGRAGRFLDTPDAPRREYDPYKEVPLRDLFADYNSGDQERWLETMDDDGLRTLRARLRRVKFKQENGPPVGLFDREGGAWNGKLLVKSANADAWRQWFYGLDTELEHRRGNLEEASRRGSKGKPGKPPKPPKMQPVSDAERKPLPHDPDETRTSQLQARLSSLGHSIKVDGHYGPKTHAEVLQFQAAHGLTPDGVVGPLTTQRLRAPEDPAGQEAQAAAGREGKMAPGEVPAEHAEAMAADDATLYKGLGVGDRSVHRGVLDLQKALAELGYDVEEDGRFGPETEAAVMAMQQHFGLKADGVVGDKTHRVVQNVQKKRVQIADAEDQLTEATDGREVVALRARIRVLREQMARPLEEGLLQRGRKTQRFGGKIYDFDPSKHPRDRSGQFQKAVGKLRDEYDMVTLPNGTTVRLNSDRDALEVKDVRSDDPSKGRVLASFGVDEPDKALHFASRRDELAVIPGKDLRSAEMSLDDPNAMVADVAGGAEGPFDSPRPGWTRAGIDNAGRLRYYKDRDEKKRRPKASVGLQEANVRGASRRVPLKRLPDGTFAPKGRGQVLSPGMEVKVPHKSGSGYVAGVVQKAVTNPNKPGKSGVAVKLQSGPDAGTKVMLAKDAPDVPQSPGTTEGEPPKKQVTAWKAFDTKMGQFKAAKDSGAPKEELAKLASQVRAAKWSIKRAGGDPESRPEWAGAVPSAAPFKPDTVGMPDPNAGTAVGGHGKFDLKTGKTIEDKPNSLIDPKTGKIKVSQASKTKTDEIYALEDQLSAYHGAHYGPQWGEENEKESHALGAKLHALYEKHGVPEDERVSGAVPQAPSKEKVAPKDGKGDDSGSPTKVKPKVESYDPKKGPSAERKAANAEKMGLKSASTALVPDYSDVKLTGGKAAGGSTGAQIKDGPDGKKWLLKAYGGDQDRVATELAANAVYRAMGAKVPEMGKSADPGNGKVAIMYPLLDGKPKKITEPSAKLGEHYMTDALLANWDFVGLADDNILWGPDGEPFRVDHGGTGFYRAQGGSKPFTGPVGEIESMLIPGKGQGHKKIVVDQAGLKAQAAAIASKLTPSKIDEIAAAVPFTEGMKAKWSDAMKKRVGHMAAIGSGDEDLSEGVKKLVPEGKATQGAPKQKGDGGKPPSDLDAWNKKMVASGGDSSIPSVKDIASAPTPKGAPSELEAKLQASVDAAKTKPLPKEEPAAPSAPTPAEAKPEAPAVPEAAPSANPNEAALAAYKAAGGNDPAILAALGAAPPSATGDPAMDAQVQQATADPAQTAGALAMNTTGIDLASMSPGQVFQDSMGQQWVYHKPTPGGEFHIVKPVGGGKAKPFHGKMQPPMVSPGPVKQAEPGPVAPGAEDDLFNKLSASVDLAKKGGLPVQQKGFAPNEPSVSEPRAHPNDPTPADYVAVQNKTAEPAAGSIGDPNSPGRGPTGKMRNFKAMSVGKLKAVVQQLQSYGKDPDALAAAQAVLASKL